MYKADPAPFRIVWQRSLHIHSTLESVTTIMMLLTVWSRQYVVCASPTVLPLYAAFHRCCDWPLQPFGRWHSARPYFLQPLWGTSLKGCWSNGIERNSQGIQALTCSHSLRRKDWGPPRPSSTHSSLVWATSLWPKLRSFDGSPCLRLPSADGQLSWLASD